jgi:hypothetical protein
MAARQLTTDTSYYTRGRQWHEKRPVVTAPFTLSGTPLALTKVNVLIRSQARSHVQYILTSETAVGRGSVTGLNSPSNGYFTVPEQELPLLPGQYFMDFDFYVSGNSRAISGPRMPLIVEE